MESRYATLKILYDLVEEKVYPTQYRCPVSELLVRGNRPWDQLLDHLQRLSAEGLVQLYPAASVQVSITVEGLDKISTLSGIHLL